MSTRATRGFWMMRDLPAVGWLCAAAVVAVAHAHVSTPTWLLIHLVLLGAATHSILVWSRYFTDALLHTSPEATDREGQNRRLVLLNFGALLVLVGVPMGWWPLTLTGGTAVAVAVLWHGATIGVLLRRALPARFGMSVRYYLVSAALLPIGVTIGVVLARTTDDSAWHDRLMVAHASVNLLGWIGVTALGTLVTLWPTMLRTAIVPGTERAATRALPLLAGAVLLTGAGPLVDLPLLLVTGFALYLVGIGVLAVAWIGAVRSRPPTSFATLSVAAALTWLVVCLTALTVGAAADPTWAGIHEVFEELTPFVAVGFGVQLLLGALSYLVPVALGGGPSPVRAANAVLDRGTAVRVVGANAGLAVALLAPISSTARLWSAGVAALSFAIFLPLLPLALRTSRTARRAAEDARAAR